jgi:hypothetical protein
MSHSPCPSTAPAAASSDCPATDSCREAELESPVNEYGFREAVTQEQVNRLLKRVGVIPCIDLANLQAYDGVLADIQRHTEQEPEMTSLYCFRGADVPALLPAPLGEYPVWYIRLQANMAHFIPELLQSTLGGHAGYTDNPWVRASYLQIASDTFVANDGKTESPDAFLRLAGC